MNPSNRGELEITDLNLAYLKKDLLRVQILGRGVAWLDSGTANSLQDVSQFVKAVEERQSYIKFLLSRGNFSKNGIHQSR